MSSETRISVALAEEALAALDDWIADQPAPGPSREAAASLAVCEWLAAMRLLPADACTDEKAA